MSNEAFGFRPWRTAKLLKAQHKALPQHCSQVAAGGSDRFWLDVYFEVRGNLCLVTACPGCSFSIRRSACGVSIVSPYRSRSAEALRNSYLVSRYHSCVACLLSRPHLLNFVRRGYRCFKGGAPGPLRTFPRLSWRAAEELEICHRGCLDSAILLWYPASSLFVPDLNHFLCLPLSGITAIRLAAQPRFQGKPIDLVSVRRPERLSGAASTYT